MKEKIKIAIIEDEAEILNGYCFILNQTKEYSCIGFSSAENALADLGRTDFQVILMDVNLPGMSGIDLTRIIKAKYPQILILMFTVYENSENVFKALKAGANGYLLKQSTPAELLKAIEEALNGGAPMTSSIARMVVSSFSAKSDKNVHNLSQREMEVLEKLAEGFRYTDIAEQLFVSVSTVRSHIYNIYEKLHVNNRTEALNKFNNIR